MYDERMTYGFTRNSQMQNTTTVLNEKFMRYQRSFSNTYSQIKTSLNQINDNIINYKIEIQKLEEFLETINEHEKNYKLIQAYFENIINNLQETINTEKIIDQLSSNQQIINMNEYLTLYKKVKSIIAFFKESKLQDKDDFVKNLNKLMYKGFKVFQDAFYVIIKRYDQISQSGKTEEKTNLLTKIKNLSHCLQDDEIGFDFTSGLIEDHTNKICIKIDEIKLNNPIDSVQGKGRYLKESGYGPKILKEVASFFSSEKSYIEEILSNCNQRTIDNVLKSVFLPPLEKIISILKEITTQNTKVDMTSFGNDIVVFFHNVDILNTWNENASSIFGRIVNQFQPDSLEEIINLISAIQGFCGDYLGTLNRSIETLNNEKIENENVLSITNKILSFFEDLVAYPSSYKMLISSDSEEGNKLSLEKFITLLITKIEAKASVLEKKYPPLKCLLLMNNITFIKIKVYSKTLSEFFSEELKSSFDEKINKLIEEYLKLTWAKVDEGTFKESKEGIVYEADGKTLKQTSKEIIKKKFSTFNETMKINLKFQQHLQIIDKELETKIIDANIDYLSKRYQEFFDKYNTTGFTKFRNKYILYSSGLDVEQDLKLYFMPDNSEFL